MRLFQITNLTDHMRCEGLVKIGRLENEANEGGKDAVGKTNIGPIYQTTSTERPGGTFRLRVLRKVEGKRG